jgi:putative GTP pyrophosphokinase
MSAEQILYSKSQVNRAGKILVNDNSMLEDIIWATAVLSNWRAAHLYPINTFQSTLRKRLKSIDRSALVAQRLKRMPSVVKKLKRYESMNLSRMQDIGGLRAVVGSISKVNKLYRLYKNGLQHTLISCDDYIKNPKPDGYRSIHVIFKYKNRLNSNYDGLQVELQIRTKLQHAWATAVEAMSTYLGVALKSGEG